jgi:septum formation protein
VSLPLILASASPRRKQILTDMGVSFEVVITGADEIVHPESPLRTVEENAIKKASWCKERHPDRRIIAADTTIDLDGRNIGKPASRDEAREFFRLFSGRAHSVLTSVAFVHPDRAIHLETVRSQVNFKVLSDDDIRSYFESIDPMDKAGAYDINHSREMIIDSHDGSFTNIMGLPEEPVARWLANAVRP